MSPEVWNVVRAAGEEGNGINGALLAPEQWQSLAPILDAAGIAHKVRLPGEVRFREVNAPDW